MGVKLVVKNATYQLVAGCGYVLSQEAPGTELPLAYLWRRLKVLVGTFDKKVRQSFNIKTKHLHLLGLMTSQTDLIERTLCFHLLLR